MRDGISGALRAILWFMIIAAGFRYVAAPWIFSFFYSFQIHIGIAVMLGSALTYLFRRSRMSALQFAIGALLVAHPFLMQREFVGSQPAAGARVEPIHLMSLNILVENWNNGSAIVDMILKADPDVVFIMEARPLQGQLPKLDKVYNYRMGCGILTKACDLMVLSKRPFVNPRMMDLSDLREHRFGVADIEVAGRPVQFAAAHLTKPYYDDYHSEELLAIQSHMRSVHGDFVLAGDFNSSSLAPDMQSFLRRSGLRTGQSEPATWPIEAGPFGIPIDHVFTTPGVAILSVDKVVIPGSNHYGLDVRLGVIAN